MIEPVNDEEFISRPERRKPEQFQHVKVRIDGGVARMTLSRPEHNLLNEAMLRELADGITHAGERDEVKLIVLDSACKVFCGGWYNDLYTCPPLSYICGVCYVVHV